MDLEHLSISGVYVSHYNKFKATTVMFLNIELGSDELNPLSRAGMSLLLDKIATSITIVISLISP